MKKSNTVETSYAHGFVHVFKRLKENISYIVRVDNKNVHTSRLTIPKIKLNKQIFSKISLIAQI